MAQPIHPPIPDVAKITDFGNSAAFTGGAEDVGDGGAGGAAAAAVVAMRTGVDIFFWSWVNLV